MPNKELVDALAAAGPLITIELVLLVLVCVIGGVGVVAVRLVARAGQNIAMSQRDVAETLKLLTTQTAKTHETADATHQAIKELRHDLDQHVVQINLRFDQLPDQFQRILGAEMARQYGKTAAERKAAPGVLGWLFGGERLS